MADLVRAEHGDGDEPEDLLDFGFFYPLSYVVQTWSVNRQHGILPEPGGWNDQDWRLVEHDWGILNKRYNLASFRLYPPGEQRPAERGGAAIEDLIDQHSSSPTDFQSFMQDR